MLKSAAVTEVRDRLGETAANADFWTDTYIKARLEDAVTQFAYEERWEWLQSVQTNVPLTAGNYELELIDDIDVNRHMVMFGRPTGDTDDVRAIMLKRVPTHTGYKLRLMNPTRGIPEWYYVSHVLDNDYSATDPDNPSAMAIVVHVVPTPSEDWTFEFLYHRNPAAAADNEELQVPAQYMEAVIAYATGMCWLLELNGAGKAQEQFNIYQAVLDKARKAHKSLADDEILAWGAEEPQGRPRAERAWVERRLPAGGLSG